MTEQHPITPPPELVEQWRTAPEEYTSGPKKLVIITRFQAIATRAARWGADQELEACCEWFIRDWTDIETANKLRAARRPKPPSLKEQALKALDQADKGLNESEWQQRSDTIRRALESLPS